MSSRLYYDLSKYYEERAKLPKPDGVYCIICKKPFDKPDKRRSYCSHDCFSTWYTSLAVNSWSRTKEYVLKRDGKCLECGVKVGTPQEQFNKNNTSLIKFRSSTVIFEVHHIIPISEGGDEFDPDNCMTLCYDCHKEKHSIYGKRMKKNHSLKEYLHA